MLFRPGSSKSVKFAVALLAGVAVSALTLPGAAFAQHHGGGGGGGGGGHAGGGGGGGGGGFHMGGGGGGGGFHMGGGGGGGGGGFHMGGGGGGGFHAAAPAMGGGGGGFHMGGGGGGVHAFGGGGGFHPNGGFGAHSFSRSVPAFGGHAITSRSEGRNLTAGGNAARLQGNAARIQGNAARLEGNAGRVQGNAARVEGNAARLQGNAGRIEGNAARLQGNATGAAATHNIFSAHPQFGGAHPTITHTQFAHNQFAAQNFRGLFNFNHTGFNRNAFGDPGHWNRWGGRFWGAGWHRWGFGWGGWAGPVFWPFLYGDIFSFAFWPYDYYDPFWAYGSDFVLASIFAPGPYFGSDYGYGPDYYGYGAPANNGYGGSADVYYGGNAGPPQGVTKADRQALAETDAAATESCNGLAPGVTDLPIAQIKARVRPTADQLTILDELSAASAKASEAVKASCPTAIPLTPMARLDAAEARLNAMIQAVDIVRDPLQRFYESLSDAQKRQFDAMGNAPGKAAGQAPAGGNVVALCSQQSGDATNVPVQRIEQVVQPTAEQQPALDALKQASRDAADQLQTSCPAQVPQTPVERLDAVKTRLQAMVAAMNTVRPKLQAFYASLNDEQKARFNTMGPPPNASAQQQGSNR